jgi:hypothetical protein
MEKSLYEISKEEVAHLRFPAEDVIREPEESRRRANLLHQATALGNIEKHKVKIVFEDDKGLKHVVTTIWALTEKMILLKGGVGIPVNRIHMVDL